MSQVQIAESLHKNTQAKYRSILRKYGVSESTTWADVMPKLDQVTSINTRRSDIIVLRIYLPKQDAPKIPAAVRRSYDLPTPEFIRDNSEGPYQAMILAMAYAGLRIGEACALKPYMVQKSGSTCWIDVDKSKDYTNTVGKAKSTGRVVIPEWLYDILKTADYPEILPNSLFKWMKRRGLQPHGLRHFYATYLVEHVANVEVARRQLRHKNLATTLQTYVEITAQSEMQAIAGLVNPFAA